MHPQIITTNSTLFLNKCRAYLVIHLVKSFPLQSIDKKKHIEKYEKREIIVGVSII